MSVALVEDDDSSYPPPKLRDGSPQIPTGVRQPAKGDIVFVDTSAMFVDDSRLPLLLLSFGGYLDVCWSPYVDGEVARVATREQAVATLTRAPQNLPRQLTADLESRRHEIDRVIAEHEQRWRSPDPASLRSVLVETPNLPVADPNDHPILAAAVAVGAPFLLSGNSRHFPYGQSYEGVTFWNPDTFLTAFFLIHPEAYVFVRQEYDLFAAQMGAQLRP